jgi:hypothetical protein|tara:strand:- start:521 stop:703 length:183 start_codon:yes stop_codon:yes gene_type:complete
MRLADYAAEVKVLMAADPEAIRDYLIESLDNNWEGFTAADKVVLESLMVDMALYLHQIKE